MTLYFRNKQKYISMYGCLYIIVEKQNVGCVLLSAANFTSSGAVGNSFGFSGFNAVFGAAYRPCAGWLMVNVCFNVHDNGRVV